MIITIKPVDIKEDEAKLGSYSLNDFGNNKGMTVSSEKTS